MQKILRKRMFRELRSNKWRYLALGLLIVLGMYMVVSLVGAAETVIQGVDSNAQEKHLEDGEFSVYKPLEANVKEQLENEGVTLESKFSLDFILKDSSTMRVFENRNEINQVTIDEGRAAENTGEVVIEKRYCEEHNLKVNDNITIDGQTLTIVGIGAACDYDAMYKNTADTSVQSKKFGIAFVTSEEYKTLKDSKHNIKSEDYTYSYLLNGKITDQQMKDDTKRLIKNANKAKANILTEYMKAEDNPRIKASANDQIINKYSGLASGVIVIILFTYVISVFVIHGIEQESSVIGALYSLGVKKRDLMLHYLTLPVCVTFLGGLIGSLLAFSKFGVAVQLQDCYGYYSVPILAVRYPIYLIFYGVVMPPVVSAIVNYIVINKKLSEPALKMIRNEQKASKVSKLKLTHFGFVGRFRIRQMIRESRTGLTVIFGMFIALLIVMLGLDCYSMCNYMSRQNKEDTKYKYMYTYKFPDQTVPDGGTAAYARAFAKKNYGYNIDVTLLGIDDDNPYFDVKPVKGEDSIIVSSAVAEKFGIKKGDSFTMKDKEDNSEITMKVNGISDYSVGLYVFMDLQSMRERFDEEDNFYNVVFSNKDLKIDADKLYAVTTKEDIDRSADVFLDMMWSMIITLLSVSAIIFAVVMYLMMKVMIDRSTFSISLIKIFGYRLGEIRKLYLNGNFYIIAVGAAICIPISKKAMDLMYPALVGNVAAGMHLSFAPEIYAIVYISIIVLYLAINKVLMGKVKKMVPAEVLKNRE